MSEDADRILAALKEKYPQNEVWIKYRNEDETWADLMNPKTESSRPVVCMQVNKTENSPFRYMAVDPSMGSWVDVDEVLKLVELSIRFDETKASMREYTENL